MSAFNEEFAAILLARKTVTPEKLIEAWRLAGRREVPVADALVMLGHATAEEVAAARAALGRWSDFADVLIWRQAIGAGQAQEARSIARQTGERLADVLIKLGHANEQQVMRAVAEF